MSLSIVQGPSSFLVIAYERSIAYGKCLNFQEDNVWFVMFIWQNVKELFCGGNLVQCQGSFNYFFIIDKLIWPLCYVFLESLIFNDMHVFWHMRSDIVSFNSVGRQSSQLWKPAAPPLKRSWNIHGSSLVWSKQKFEKKTWLVIQLQLWEVTNEAPLPPPAPASTTTNNSVSARVSQQQLVMRGKDRNHLFCGIGFTCPQPTTMNHTMDG